MSPPLRDKRNQPVLWSGLQSGLVQTVATDHAPFDFRDAEADGSDDFTKIPTEIPTARDRSPPSAPARSAGHSTAPAGCACPQRRRHHNFAPSKFARSASVLSSSRYWISVFGHSPARRAAAPRSLVERFLAAQSGTM